MKNGTIKAGLVSNIYKPLEGMINMMKVLQKQTYGYRDKEFFKLKELIKGCSLLRHNDVEVN